jgi:aconitate hydratase
VYLPGIRAALLSGAEEIRARIIRNGESRPLTSAPAGNHPDERDVILAGCLINSYTQ